MDVKWNDPANGTPIWFWPCDFNVAQQWTFVPVASSGPDAIYEIQRYGAPRICLDLDIGGAVGDYGHGNGAKVQEWSCNGSNNQRWRLKQPSAASQDLQIISIYSDTATYDGCVDINIAAPGQATGDYWRGTPLQQWQCLGSNQLNQLWSWATG